MKALTTITTAAFLLGAGYALAEDTTTSATANPSSSGRPSAILNDSECQNVWQNASNATGSATSGTMSDSTQQSGKTASGQKSDMGSSSEGSSPGAESTGSSSSKSSSGPSSAAGSMTADTGAGNLSKEQANQYVANFAMVDKDKDGQISQVEFQDGCKNGWVQQTASGNSGTSNAQ